uniref:Coiled-coil domain-containing protein 172 n=1 Tax=Salvator merianae TaxID=96440 RepID=A0A8D0B8F9_SALMN
NLCLLNLFLQIQLLSEKLFSLELLKKREESLQKQKTEVLKQKSNLLETYMDAKRKIAAEDEKFLKAITDFNNEFGLTSNRELLIKETVKAEMCDLEEKEKVLRNEIKTMEHKNAELKMFQLQKNELEQDLFTLQKKLKEIIEAKQITKCLEAEKIKISEKPQTDLEYLPTAAFSSFPMELKHKQNPLNEMYFAMESVCISKTAWLTHTSKRNS